MEKNLSKRELRALVRSTARNADLTTICRMYYESTGIRPTIYRTATGLYQEERELNSMALNCWAYAFGCTANEVRHLKRLELDNERYTRRHSLSPHYKYGRHGFYKPTPKHEAMKILRSYKLDPCSPYAKRLIKGHTHLYAASPYYGHSDYNKSIVMTIAGHETFVDKIVGYCDNIQEKHEISLRHI